jgi:hypothetical protein
MNNVTIAAELKRAAKDRRVVAAARRKNIIEAIAVLYILLFFYTALSKTLWIGPTVDVLKFTPFFKMFPQVTAWTVVMAEYVIAVLLFFPRTRKIGLYSSLFLMMGFTGYIVWMMRVSPNLPCTCGGVIASMNWIQHLIFNIAFMLLALWNILLMRKNERNTI